MVPTVGGSPGKSEDRGIQKYQGAKVNKDAEKYFELLYADCVPQFEFFWRSLRLQIICTSTLKFVPLPLFLV